MSSELTFGAFAVFHLALNILPTAKKLGNVLKAANIHPHPRVLRGHTRPRLRRRRLLHLLCRRKSPLQWPPVYICNVLTLPLQRPLAVRAEFVRGGNGRGRPPLEATPESQPMRYAALLLLRQVDLLRGIPPPLRHQARTVAGLRLPAASGGARRRRGRGEVEVRFLEGLVVKHEAVPDDDILVVVDGSDREGRGEGWSGR